MRKCSYLLLLSFIFITPYLGCGGGGLDGTNQGGSNFICGNGSVEGTEQCDDSNLTDGDGCESDCTLTSTGGNQDPDPVCGDEQIQTGETCDDGNTTSGDGCDSSCQLEGPVCGNGFVEGTEQCDDSNLTDGDGCESDCTNSPGVTAKCGDGILQEGESCDLGANNSNTGTCHLDCSLATCGDNTINTGESCDGTSLNGKTCQALGFNSVSGNLKCSSTCQFDTSSCVNGVTLPWLTQVGSERTDFVHEVLADKSGHLFVSGQFAGASIVLPFVGNKFVTISNQDQNYKTYEAFLGEVDPATGLFKWVDVIATDNYTAPSQATYFYDDDVDIHLDSAGRLYALGSIKGKVLKIKTYLPSGTSQDWVTLTNTSVDDRIDSYIWRINVTNGSVIWSVSAGGTRLTNQPGYTEHFWGLTEDSAGNLYYTGEFDSKKLVLVSSGGGDKAIDNIETDESVVIADAFFGKINPDTGALGWITLIASKRTDHVRELIADKTGHLYVSAQFGGNTLVLKSGSADITIQNTDQATSNHTFDALMGQVNPVDGTFKWVDTFRTKTSTKFNDEVDIQLDSKGNLYAMGLLDYTTYNVTTYKANSNPIDRGDITNTSVPQKTDSYIWRVNPSDGALVWRVSATGDAQDFLAGLTEDPAGYLYYTGEFRSSQLIMTTTAGGNLHLSNQGGSNLLLDGFFGKIEPATGELIWLTQVGTDRTDHVHELIADKTGHLYVAAQFAGNTVKLPFGLVTVTLPNADSDQTNYTFDAIFGQVDPNDGTFKWVNKINTTSGVVYHDDIDIQLDSSGNLYALGGVDGGTLQMKTYAAIGTAVPRDTFTNTQTDKHDAAIWRVAPTTGAIIWRVTAQGNEDDYLYGLTEDPSKSLYYTGGFSSASLDIFAGTQKKFTRTLTGNTSLIIPDGFFGKIIP